MSLTLDGTLQTRLNGIEREPLAQLVTTSFANAIPFNGNNFGLSESNNVDLDLKLHSSGALILVSSRWDEPYRFRYMKTDANRQAWTEYLIDGEGYWLPGIHPKYLTCTERVNGDIVVAWKYDYSDKDYVAVTIVPFSGIGWSDSDTYDLWTSATDDVVYGLYMIYNPSTGNHMLFMTWYDDSSGNYYLYLNEASDSDLTSWSGWTDITPASLGNAARYGNPHAIYLSDGDIALSFEFVTGVDAASGYETSNVYYMVSDDDGVTWSTPTQVSSYTGVGEAGEHPSVAEKTSGIYFNFHETALFVLFDRNTPSIIIDSSYLYSQDIHLYNNKFYITGGYTSGGIKYMSGMWVGDPTDMSVVKNYTSTTTPGYDPDVLLFHSWYNNQQSAGKYMCRYIESCGGKNVGSVVVCEYDGVTDKVTQYIIGPGVNCPAYGWTENVFVEESSHWVSNFNITAAMIDADNDRLYVWMYDGYLYSNDYCCGYIDLTESPDPGTGYYTWNELFRGSSYTLRNTYGWVGSNCGDMNYVTFCKEDRVIIACSDRQVGSNGGILVYDADTGILQHQMCYDNDPNTPYNGLFSSYVYDNKIYGSFLYTTNGGQGSWRGLWIYDMITGSKVIARPGYASKDQYSFYDYDFADIGNNYIWIAGFDGAIRYHTGSQAFEIWSENYATAGQLPGFNMGMSDAYGWRIAYDVSSGDVYLTCPTGAYTGVRRFNVNGHYYKGQYATGTKVLTDLGLGSINDLTEGFYEKDIVPAVDENDVMWCWWQHRDYDNSEEDIYWDNDESESDVSDDLTDTLEIAHAIDTPSELTFQLANGHLYDPQNSFSNFSYMFRRGRKVKLKLGENISGTPYWVDQGIYYVEEIQLRHKRGDYPVMEVTAKTIDSLWREARVVLSDYYDEAQPKAIVEDILDNWTVLSGAQYSIPTLANSHEIWHQWSDETIYEIIKDVLDHFGYIYFFTNAGVFSPKQINFSASIDHTYPDDTQIADYTPDTSFSSFVNQLRVIGETHDFIEVVYDPELITNVSGTCGWWNETIVKRVYYNEERTRTCRNPYLVPIISTKDFKYFLFKGGGGEEISDIDSTNELWVEVTIEGPNLIPYVVGLAVGTIAFGASAIACSYACGPWIFGTNVFISLLCYAVLATATYDIEVWAQPVGEEKQTIQYVSTDASAMNILNQQPVIEEIEDPLCYTVADCQRVAELELNILKYQRERIKLNKIAHLQDELLDMIVVKHPYTQVSMQIMVATLRRTLRIKEDMSDYIEGWRII